MIVSTAAHGSLVLQGSTPEECGQVAILARLFDTPNPRLKLRRLAAIAETMIERETEIFPVDGMIRYTSELTPAADD